MILNDFSLSWWFCVSRLFEVFWSVKKVYYVFYTNLQEWVRISCYRLVFLSIRTEAFWNDFLALPGTVLTSGSHSVCLSDSCGRFSRAFLWTTESFACLNLCKYFFFHMQISWFFPVLFADWFQSFQFLDLKNILWCLCGSVSFIRRVRGRLCGGPGSFQLKTSCFSWGETRYRACTSWAPTPSSSSCYGFSCSEENGPIAEISSVSRLQVQAAEKFRRRRCAARCRYAEAPYW